MTPKFKLKNIPIKTINSVANTIPNIAQTIKSNGYGQDPKVWKPSL